MQPIARITPASPVRRIGRPQPAAAPAAAAAPVAMPATALVPVHPGTAADLQPRRVSAPFVAQLFAAREQMPQARAHRRAEPEVAIGRYAAASVFGTEPPAGRVFTGEI